LELLRRLAWRRAVAARASIKVVITAASVESGRVVDSGERVAIWKEERLLTMTQGDKFLSFVVLKDCMSLV
jgi:hypothetical protein